MKYFNFHLFISIVLIRFRFFKLKLKNYYLIYLILRIILTVFEFCETNLMYAWIKLDPIATRG